MTEPTPEQIAALQPGDVVTLKPVTVTERLDGDGDIYVVGSRRNANESYVHSSAIASIQPRPIAAGDRVAVSSVASPATVLFVGRWSAFVRHDGNGVEASWPHASLTRVS